MMVVFGGVVFQMMVLVFVGVTVVAVVMLQGLTALRELPRQEPEMSADLIPCHLLLQYHDCGRHGRFGLAGSFRRIDVKPRPAQGSNPSVNKGMEEGYKTRW